MRTSNFSLSEVANRPLPSHLIPVGYAAMQYLQAVRDAGSKHFGRPIPLRITSGYRPLQYNRSIGSSDRSYHIWRLGGSTNHAKDSRSEYNKVLFAVDFMPIGVDIGDYFDWFKDLYGGERYMHSKKNFIHTAPNADDKAPWVV